MFRTMIFLCVIATALLFIGISATLINPMDHYFKVTRLEQCDEQSKWDIFLKLVDFTVVGQDGVDVALSGAMQVVKPIQINFRLSVHGLQCDGPEDRVCKHKFIREFGYVCSKLNDFNGPWYPFILDKFRCPIPVGYYTMSNVKMNVNTLIQLPLTEGYWVLKAVGYRGREVIMCVYSEIVIWQRRVPGNKENETYVTSQ